MKIEHIPPVRPLASGIYGDCRVMPRLADARTIRSTLLCVGLVLAIGFPRTILADTAGIASVIDGDTIEIHGQRARLHGIDAPEGGQACLDVAGRNWRCGQRAALALQDLIGRRTVTCDERDVDRYGRVVGRCLVGDLDINEWLVARPGARLPQVLARLRRG
jgi:endonuclease YncB( thermonuclease family)